MLKLNILKAKQYVCGTISYPLSGNVPENYSLHIKIGNKFKSKGGNPIEEEEEEFCASKNVFTNHFLFF